MHVDAFLIIMHICSTKECVMNKLFNLSKITLGIAALSLSTSLWAGTTESSMWDPVNDTMRGSEKMIRNLDVLGAHHAMSGPVYIVTDKYTGNMYEMDGIKCGKVVSHEGGMVMDESELMGDRITDMRTNHSGVITGIKDQGTMEVTHDNGKTVRYQYVTFKIKHDK